MKYCREKDGDIYVKLATVAFDILNRNSERQIQRDVRAKKVRAVSRGKGNYLHIDDVVREYGVARDRVLDMLGILNTQVKTDDGYDDVVKDEQTDTATATETLPQTQVSQEFAIEMKQVLQEFNQAVQNIKYIERDGVEFSRRLDTIRRHDKEILDRLESIAESQGITKKSPWKMPVYVGLGVVAVGLAGYLAWNMISVTMTDLEAKNQNSIAIMQQKIGERDQVIEKIMNDSSMTIEAQTKAIQDYQAAISEYKTLLDEARAEKTDLSGKLDQLQGKIDSIVGGEGEAGGEVS